MGSAELLGKVFNQVWRRREERELLSLMLDDETIKMAFNRKPMTVKNRRRLANILGISFPGLLAGDSNCWTSQLDMAWLLKLPVNLRPAKRRKWVDRDELQTNLTALRDSIDSKSPPSLASFAKVLGISTGGLEYLHPTVCSEIKNNYKNWLKDEHDRKRTQSLAEVVAYLDSDESNKSRKHALKTIRSRTNLPKNVLMKTISEEFSRCEMG